VRGVGLEAVGTGNVFWSFRLLLAGRTGNGEAAGVQKRLHLSGGVVALCRVSQVILHTIRTARWRTFDENLFVVLLIVGPSSQELGPSTIRGGSMLAYFQTALAV
jgi:hypothetical protein